MLLLMRDRHAPLDAATFRERLKDFLQQVDRGARRLQADAEDIYLVKYAFCALVDERDRGVGHVHAAEGPRECIGTGRIGTAGFQHPFFQQRERLFGHGVHGVPRHMRRGLVGRPGQHEHVAQYADTGAQRQRERGHAPAAGRHPRCNP